jgi:competence protein ComEC
MKKKHPWVMTCCLVGGLVGAILCSWLEPRMDDFRFTAVDVGQGQCLILQNEGKYYMVDCGGDTGDKAADKASQLLLSQGVFRLDGLIITHYDADHAGGVSQLLSRIPTNKIYMPITDGDNRLRDELTQKYSDKIQWVESQTQLNEVDITIYPSVNREDANESSLCILFQPADCDILITGDRSFEGETELMNQVELPDLEIIVAGHHGSRTSTSWDLLNETRPDIAVISVGADNRYGHPTWDTLERLKLFGCGIYRTDLEGTLIFRG